MHSGISLDLHPRKKEQLEPENTRFQNKRRNIKFQTHQSLWGGTPPDSLTSGENIPKIPWNKLCCVVIQFLLDYSRCSLSRGGDLASCLVYRIRSFQGTCGCEMFGQNQLRIGTSFTSHSAGWSIGIFIMAIYNPYIQLGSIIPYMCQARVEKTPSIGDGHPTVNDGNPYTAMGL